MTDNGLLALGANLGEQRIFLYLDAPSLVVGEMPMEAVDIVQGEHVDKLAYGIGSYEMARHVEVGSAIGEAWRVSDMNGWYAHLCSLAVAEWQRLAQSLDTVEHARSRSSGYMYLLGV